MQSSLCQNIWDTFTQWEDYPSCESTIAKAENGILFTLHVLEQSLSQMKPTKQSEAMKTSKISKILPVHNTKINPYSNHKNLQADVFAYVVAIFLPPLAVFLKRGCGADFLINICLSILGWIPGVIRKYQDAYLVPEHQ